MAFILRYFTEFSSFRGPSCKSSWLAINRFSPEKCHKVHQLSTMELSTTVALCFSFVLYDTVLVDSLSSVLLVAQLIGRWRDARCNSGMY